MPRRTQPIGYCVLTPEVLATLAEVKAEGRTARKRSQPCGCTTHERCPEAVRLRQAHSAAWVAHDTPAIVEARQAYGAHLRQAGVMPGQAQWEEGV